MTGENFFRLEPEVDLWTASATSEQADLDFSLDTKDGRPRLRVSNADFSVAYDLEWVLERMFALTETQARVDDPEDRRLTVGLLQRFLDRVAGAGWKCSTLEHRHSTAEEAAVCEREYDQRQLDEFQRRRQQMDELHERGLFP